MLMRDGIMVVGVPEKDVQISAHSLISVRRNLAGSLMWNSETKEVLNFCCKHNIECNVKFIPIQKVNEAY